MHCMPKPSQNRAHPCAAQNSPAASKSCSKNGNDKHHVGIDQAKVADEAASDKGVDVAGSGAVARVRQTGNESGNGYFGVVVVP